MLDEELDGPRQGEQDELRAEVQPESRARGALLRQTEALRGAIYPAWLEARALERDVRRRRPDLRVGAAEDPGDAQGPVLVGDDEDVRREDPLHTIERLEGFTGSRATGHERVAPQPIGVVRMQRLSQLEHHVVRDVHGVVDRPHARGDQSLLHPGRRRPDRDIREVRGPEAPAPVGIFDAYIQLRPVEVVSQLRHLRLAERDALQRGQLPRDADDPHAVGAVRLELDDEHRVAEGVGERLPHGERPVEDEDAVVILSESELLFRAHHAFADDAADPPRLERQEPVAVAVPKRGADLGVRDDVARGEVRRTGDDGLLAAIAVVHRREEELVGVRMLLELRDAPHPDVLPAPARPLDAVDLGPAHVQLARDVVDRAAGVRVLLQPRERNADGGHYTDSRYRRSF